MTNFTVLGVDPSSTCCGVSIVKNGSPTHISHFVSNKKLDLGRRIWEFGNYLRSVRAKQKIDLIAVEEVSKSRNLNTVRKIAYFESVALAKAGEWNIPTLLLSPKTARKHGVGNGSLSKEQTFAIMSKKYDFCEGKYALDECDSLVIALAGYKLKHG